MKKVFFRGRQDKLELMGREFSSYLSKDVLDVGCDQKFIKKMVGGKYVGIDAGGVADIILNLELGLPFKVQSFDAVVAFDSLEHIDRAHFLFDELCRVSRKYVIIGLPNMYEWRFRLMFLLGKKISGKYGLPVDSPLDRHRWLLSLDEARRFIRYRGLNKGFRVKEEYFGYYQYRRLGARFFTFVGYLLGSRFASLFAYHYWAVIERDP